jgi:hypothetical protein
MHFERLQREADYRWLKELEKLIEANSLLTAFSLSSAGLE